MTERAAAIPGVKSAALTAALLGQGLENAEVTPEGFRFPHGEQSEAVFYDRVGENYFDTFGIPIQTGRGFTAGDNRDTPAVAVINDIFSPQFWPGQNPLGKRIRLNGVKWVEVVGVARNSHYAFVGEPPRDFLYLAYRQSPQGSLTLLAASAGDSARLLIPLRRLVQEIDPALPVYDVRTMEEFYDAKVTGFGTILVETVAAMGLIGLALATVGLYALMSFSVSRRTREIGIRMAVGADRIAVMRMWCCARQSSRCLPDSASDCC